MFDGRMNRRDFIRTAAGAAAGFAALGSGALSFASSGDKPNVVFILTDDHRYDAFGFMDKPWLKTPSMDRMAAEGVHFRNSFVTTSLCSPSRASFLTGMYANRHGVKNNLTPWDSDNVTFLEMLHAQGYHTGFIGKWHMPGRDLPDMVGQGKLDRMISFTHMGGQGVYYDCPLYVDGEKTEREGYITDVLTDYALEFLEEGRGKPFCLFLSHKAVHHEFLPPPRYKGRLDDMPLHPLEEPRIHTVGRAHDPQLAEFEKNQQGYYEALMAVDDSVGRVLNYLDEKALSENTLVIYAGDNGYFWGEHGLIDKRYAYEESIRIPTLMRFPRLHGDGGRGVDEMILNIDLAPTILAATGLDIPADMQGMNYLGLSAGETPRWRDSWMYEYFHDLPMPHPTMKAVRTTDWKLIKYFQKQNSFPDEMYHLAEDPGERNNLAGRPEYREKEKELNIELKRLYRKYG